MGAKAALSAVLRTLGFHAASLAFGLLLLALLALTGSTLLLVLVCLLSGSSRAVRQFVAFLWRAELWINALVADERPAAGSRRHSHGQGHSRGHQGQEGPPPQREVTLTVMVASLVYFLLFKWVLNTIFSVFPLALWLIAVLQLLPADSALADGSFVASDSAFGKGFTALAFAFFAHQLGVSAAHGLCFVSSKVTELLFDRTSERSGLQAAGGSLFPAGMFGAVPALSEMMPMQPGAAYYTQPAPMSSQYGSVAEEASASEPAASEARGRSSNQGVSQVPTAGLMPPPPLPPIPPMGPLPPFPPRFGPQVSSQSDRSERNFRRGIQEQEIQMCCLKVIVKKDDNRDRDNDHDREWDRVRGRGRDFDRRRRDHFYWDFDPRGRGRGRRGGRWDRDDVPLAELVLPDEGDANLARAVSASSSAYDEPLQKVKPSAPALESPEQSSKARKKPANISRRSEARAAPAGRDRHALPALARDISQPESVEDGTTSLSASPSSSSSSSSSSPSSSSSDASHSHKNDKRHKHHKGRHAAEEKNRKPDSNTEAVQEVRAASPEISKDGEPLTTRLVELKEHERYADAISETANELVSQQEAELLQHQSSSNLFLTSISEKSRGNSRRVGSTQSIATAKASISRRPLSAGGSDRQVHTSSRSTISLDTVELSHDEDRAVNFVPPSQAAAPIVDPTISDMEIHGAFGSIPRYQADDEEDVRQLQQFAPSNGSLEYVTGLESRDRYRDYDPFSPVSTPTNFRTGDNDSFMSNGPVYDLLSPTNSIQDDEFPSEKFQQVYRSIQRSGGMGPAVSAYRGGFDEDIPDRRDRVNFNAFAPAAVAPASTFIYSVWAFLLSQRADMYERAQMETPEAQRLSQDAKLEVRRGALVHVTLEVPDGFRILNGATQGFPWEGKISSCRFQVECLEANKVGPVMFTARIVVGAEVAVLRSYVVISASANNFGEPENAEMLRSSLEVLEKTFQEIPYRSLELKELVGQGYFGDAYRALYNGQEVVVKTIRASEFGETTTQIVKEFQHEAAVLNMFGHHPCVVPFVGASTDVKFPLCLVTKYLPYGSLEDHLRKPNADSQYSVTQKTGMLKDAAAGLLNIHEGGFIHRDIAARNCLVDDWQHVRICDFGLARRVNASGSGLMRDAFGPVKYMAPESLQPPHVFSYNSDAYMFGVLMWETYTSSPPFPTMTPVEAMMRITRGERLPVPKDIPEELRLLMESCFHDEPLERPTMGEILSSLDDSLAALGMAKASESVAAATAFLPRSSSRRDRSILV